MSRPVLDCLIVDPEAGQRHVGRMGLDIDLIQGEGEQSIGRSHEEFTVGIFTDGCIKTNAPQPITDIEISEGFALGIEPGQAAVGAQPEKTRIVLYEAVNKVARQSMVRGE